MNWIFLKYPCVKMSFLFFFLLFQHLVTDANQYCTKFVHSKPNCWSYSLTFFFQQKQKSNWINNINFETSFRNLKCKWSKKFHLKICNCAQYKLFFLHTALVQMYGGCTLWQYGLWSFLAGGTKLERFLPKNQHTQRKILNFENWVNRCQKLGIILES